MKVNSTADILPLIETEQAALVLKTLRPEGERHLCFKSEHFSFDHRITFGVVQQGAKIISATPDAEELIERAGRICYKSEPKGDPAAFIRARIRQGHTSILEHAVFSVQITCNRAIATEITRHRHTVFSPAVSQESTRYIDYNGGIAIVVPPDNPKWNEEQRCVMYDQLAMDGNHSDQAYRRKRCAGLKPEDARGSLIEDAAAEMIFTANMQEWRAIFERRVDPAAHWQVRELLGGILAEVSVRWPALFGDLAVRLPQYTAKEA